MVPAGVPALGAVRGPGGNAVRSVSSNAADCRRVARPPSRVSLSSTVSGGASADTSGRDALRVICAGQGVRTGLACPVALCMCARSMRCTTQRCAVQQALGTQGHKRRASRHVQDTVSTVHVGCVHIDSAAQQYAHALHSSSGGGGGSTLSAPSLSDSRLRSCTRTEPTLKASETEMADRTGSPLKGAGSSCT